MTKWIDRMQLRLRATEPIWPGLEQNQFNPLLNWAYLVICSNGNESAEHLRSFHHHCHAHPGMDAALEVMLAF